MIESVDVAPRFDVVASFAAEECAVRTFAGHLLIKFTLMRILMACRAGTVFEVEGKNFIRAATEAKLVAIGTGNCDVRTLERKARGAVLGN